MAVRTSSISTRAALGTLAAATLWDCSYTTSSYYIIDKQEA